MFGQRSIVEARRGGVARPVARLLFQTEMVYPVMVYPVVQSSSPMWHEFLQKTFMAGEPIQCQRLGMAIHFAGLQWRGGGEKLVAQDAALVLGNSHAARCRCGFKDGWDGLSAYIPGDVVVA